MAESDNEDEKFVKNVIHELSAFQKSGTSHGMEQSPQSVDEIKESKEMNGPETSIGDGGKETTAAENGSVKENENEPDSSNAATPEATKQPSRIIRLSRPYNPYSPARATVTSVQTSSSSGSLTQSSLSATNGTVTSPAVGPGAPGSRLAALQRPGSPMHRILQRAQSPALAAAARLTRQASGDGAQTGQINVESTPGASLKEQSNNPGEQQVAESTPENTGEEQNSENTQSTLVIPPKIQSSTLTSSILLRRPQSPLNTGKSQLLIHKQTTYPNEDGNSQRSPLSSGQNSPGDSQVSSAVDESHTADKIAIRNKLRANSFRLKDLLTKKPFIRTREGSKDENGEDSSDQNATNVSSESSEKVEGVKDASGRASEAGMDRTRWRREGLTSLSRSRSTASDRSATLISARSLRTRTRNSTQSSVEKQSDNDGKEKIEEKRQHESFSSNDEIDASSRVVDNPNENETECQRSDKNSNQVDLLANKHDSGVTRTAPRTRATVGATLLRSPRTRSSSGSSNVPSSPVEKTGSQNDFTDLSKDKGNLQSEFSDVDKLENDSEAGRKMKAISDLEKVNDVNLVFDSDSIGQTVPPEENSDQGHSQRNKEYSRSQSEFTGSQPQTEDSHKLHRHYSEPTSPANEQSSIRGSKSYDNNPDAELSYSPALKRSLAVTDLDKAMRDRDQQKLSTIFKVSSKDGQETLSRVPCSEDKTEVLQREDSQLETDLDARLIPKHRMVTSSPRIRQRDVGSQDGPQSPPLSAPPINPVAPMVYKPNVNLEDAVKWPIDLPGKLDFKKMEVFEGQMLLNWLSSSIDKSHYLRLVMTKHDINVIACQVCTCLIAAGVMKQLESKEQESVFKTDCMYYWTHTQQSSPNVNQDVNKLQPMWPPTQEQIEDNRPGLKYTEADHQAAMVTLRHEYKEEVETVKREHQGVLDKARQEYENRLQQAIERITLLQKEVEKYKCLAGIEKYSQNALSEADAAQIEAGLKPGGVNGFSTPMMPTPSMSQYHTPAGTPDALNIDFPINVVKSSNELFAEFKTQPEGLQDGTSCSGSDTTSLAGSIGEWSEGGTPLIPPPPAPPPPPGIPPPPAPPLPGALVKRALKPPVNPMSPMRPLFWNRIQVNDIKTPKHKEYLDKKLVWEDLQEEKIDVQELDQLFSKRNIEPSRRFSPNKPKNKAKQAAKVISPKRSQVIGILLSSLRLEMSEIEHAILTFDTSQLGEEKLRQIYENRGDNDEMKKIKEHMKKHPDTPLDKPDQFLYDLSLIPDYSERIFCFIFREAFQESISVIETKMTNLRMTCQTLVTSIHIKRILGLVLGLGNYMNGGSKSRGQADGFGIDILPKLKDVKSKDNSTSLLHYTVQQYIKKFERQDAGTEKAKFPLPDPSDLTQACQVCFDELDKELRRIKKDFEAAEERADKVIKSARDLVYLQPFKDIMTEFFEKGRHEFIEQEENLADGKRLFEETVIYFCVKPKSGDKEVTPEYFFSCWCTFCQDFKDTWKREEQKIIKQRIKENEIRVKQMQQRLAKQPVRTRTRKAGGLKDRLTKQGLLES